MDPDKQSGPTALEAAPSGPVSVAREQQAQSEAVMIERDAITLLQQLDQFMQSKGALDEHRAKQLRKSWESLDPALPADSKNRAGLEQRFETLRERIHRQVDGRNADFAQIESLLVELRESLGGNDLAASQQLEQKVINGLNRIKGLSAQRRQKVIAELEALQPKIKKLASWRQWGTEQAREKIIEEIRTIHDNEKDLGKIAKRIQAAREEWKQWDQSGEGGDHKLYPVFDAACTKAYEPCKAWFDERRKQRQSASRHRTEVCETLEKAYEETDWRSPDWKAVQQLVREQTSRWRKLGPADYRDRKPLGKRFDSIIARFDGPLDRERKRNLKQRQELIAAIEPLSKLDDTRRAITEVQSLQKQWHVTVSGKRKQEQEIWNRFKKACDAVYDRGREAKKAFEKELGAHLEARQALCAEIESAIAENPDNGEELDGRIRQWKKTWEDAGRPPKNQARQVEKRYRDAMKAARDRLSALEQAAQAEADDILFRRAAICRELEQALLAGEAMDAGKARAAFDALPALSGEPGDAMALRFAAAETAASDTAALTALRATLDAHYETVNGYLLQLEINAGVDSPAEHSRARMALQIGRLSAAIGKGAEQELLDDATLVVRIHTTGALDAARQAETDQRFQACYQALQASA